MPLSQEAVKMRAALVQVRDALRAENATAGVLATAKEIRIGLHAKDASFRQSGVYVLPSRLFVDDSETMSTDNVLRLRVICMVKSHTADNSEDDPATFELVDLVGGVLHVVRLNRSTLAAGILEPEGDTEQLLASFELMPLQGAGYAYRAELFVNVHLEVDNDAT